MKRLLQAIAQEPWAMSPTYVQAMLDIVSYRVTHGQLSAEEVDARIGTRKERRVAEAPGNIAIIQIQGVIHNRARLVQNISSPGGASAEMADNQIRAAYGDDSIKAIVLDIDSPGGAAAGTPELGATIRELRGGEKPIIAQVNDMAASAAYWVASAADEVVAVPSAQVGSIGVIAVHEEISQMLEAEGVQETIIAAGKYKGEGNPFEPLSDEAKAAIQQTVDQYYAMFVSAVAEGRKVDREKVEADFGQGRTMLAEDARKAGMIDRLGTMRETLTRLGATFGGESRNREQSRKSVAFAKERLKLEKTAP